MTETETQRADRERRARLALMDAILAVLAAPHTGVEQLRVDIFEALGAQHPHLVPETKSDESALCSRCQRQAPDQLSDEFLEWEADDMGEQVVCPGCLTLGEEQAIADDASETVEEALRAAANDQIVADNAAAEFAAAMGLSDVLAKTWADEAVAELARLRTEVKRGPS